MKLLSPEDRSVIVRFMRVAIWDASDHTVSLDGLSEKQVLRACFHFRRVRRYLGVLRGEKDL